MCGLFAIINTDKTAVNKETLNKAIYSLSHRGPDNCQVWIKEHIGLAHQRLSIFDTSTAAHQPFVYKSLRIIFNGAIYNFLELRQELEAIGFNFKTNSDTEVVCAAYLAWGESCLNKFNGMWSFIIFDERNDSLFVSRDRFGIKPLYILKLNGSIYLSSEIKAFLEIPSYTPKLNYEMAKRFLQSGTTHHDNDTFFLNIKSFPAGAYTLINGESFETQAYYKLEDKLLDTNLQLSYGRAKEEFKLILEDALRIRLRTDVPLGFSQSGGLDSNSLIAVAKTLSHEKVKSYSVCFDEFPQEEEMINIAVKEMEVSNIKSSVNPTKLKDSLYDLCWQMDQPVVSASVLAQNYLYKTINQTDVKVILGGQGADEICYGYDSFIKMKLKKRPYLFLEAPWFYLRQLYNYLTRENTRLKIPNGIKEDESPVAEPKELAIKMINHEPLPSLLHFEDRNAMHYGIESRLPYLDYRLVEFCLSCPIHFFNEGSKRKKLLRDSISHLLPKFLLGRKSKDAFAAPIEKWSKRLYQELNVDIENWFPLVNEFLLMDDNNLSQLHSSALWRVLNLAIFRRRFGI